MSTQEIGGYLGLEKYGHALYHEDAIALDSARSCLAYLIELRDIQSIVIPDLMCSAIPETCARLRCTYRSYHVGIDFFPIYDFELRNDEWLYLSDYYGTLTENAISTALDFADGRVIVDEVQGFFRVPWGGADTIYTCRKFFGVPDGAYLATRDNARLHRPIPICHSAERMAHILGRVEDGASAHYAEYSHTEEGIGSSGPETMSEVTRFLLSGVNYEQVKITRERNFTELARLLDATNLLNTGAPVGPYMYPYLVTHAGDIRKRLAACGLYVPTLWPNVLDDPHAGPIAVDYSNNILPLPVDQRYGIGDMQRIVEMISQCLN